MTEISRRALLAHAAAATVAALSPAASITSALAGAPLSGTQAPGFYRYRIGSYELTAINDGIRLIDLAPGFVKNAEFPDVQKALADARAPQGKVPIPYTSIVVNTGSQIVLLDTGTGGRIAPTAGTWSENFAAAGFQPSQVDVIAISHFHPDHINGIRTKDDQLAFPNAEIIASAPEWAFWMDDAKMNAAPEGMKPAFNNARRVFGSIASRVKRIEPGAEIAPGIISVAAPGHTPGHLAFTVSSGNQSMMTLSDAVYYLYFASNPEWQGVFDVDGTLASETRTRLLDRVSADRMLCAGYHWPFPGCGHIVKSGSGYRYDPVAWSHLI